MSDNFSNDAQLFVGDTIQLEGAVCIVEAVGTKTADALPLDGGKAREVLNAIPRHLILKRGGQAALDAFKVGTLADILTGKTPGVKPLPKGMVRLEPGDRLCHGGEVRTVVSVTDKACVLGNADGQEFAEKRMVNEIHFNFTACGGKEVHLRLNAQQRADHLEGFLAQRKPPQAGANNETSGVKENEVMATKTKKAKTVKVKAKKKTKVEKLDNKQISYAGRGKFVFGLVKDGKSDNEILDALKEKYSVNTGSHGPKVIASARRKFKKQEAK